MAQYANLYIYKKILKRNSTAKLLNPIHLILTVKNILGSNQHIFPVTTNSFSLGAIFILRKGKGVGGWYS